MPNDHPWNRELGNTHFEELLEKARRARKKGIPATQQAVAQEDVVVVGEDAGRGPAVDGTAGGGDQAKNPKTVQRSAFL